MKKKMEWIKFLDYGYGVGDKYLRKGYNEDMAVFPELKGKITHEKQSGYNRPVIAIKDFNKIYLKYKKKGRAGKGYIHFWGE